MADTKIIEEIKTRFKEAYDAAQKPYEEMIDDLKFLAGGSQWPESIKAQRLTDERPCLEINKLPVFVDRVNGDIRQNSPSIKIKPVDSESDPETAEMLTGLIRNIEMQSSATVAYDTAAESAASCGKGTFRILTRYISDDSFEQELFIKRMKNPFTVYWGPAQEWDKSDAKHCFITEKISRDEFKAQYPKATVQDAPGGKDKDPDWADDKTIRIAEYYVKVAEKKKLYLLRDPETGEETTADEAFEGLEVLKDREIEGNKLVWYKTNGVEILEGPIDQAGTLIPIIEVWGKELNIENKTIHRGVIRHAKDPQRLYNYSRSHHAEVTGLAPKVPYLVTMKMIDNYQSFWNQAHKKNLPFLPYDADPDAPTLMPKRTEPISPNAGILAEIEIDNRDMHDTTGLQMPSVGKESSAGSSGRKELALQRQGDVGSYAYYDNLGRSLKYAGKVMVDWIPSIYDTARVVRILGEDGSDEFVQINQPFRDEETGEKRLYDLTVGKYDVVVTTGPSYNTQREEAADGMLGLMEALPDQSRMLIADLVVKNLDWPGASEIEERLKMLLPPGMNKDAPDVPDEPPPPDPAAMAEAQKTEVEIQKIQAQIDKLLAETRLKRQEAAEREMGEGED